MQRKDCADGEWRREGRKPKTEAMKNFEANLDPLLILIKRLEPERMLRDGEAAIQEIQKWRQTNFKDTDSVVTAATKFSSTVTEFLAVHELVFNWMSVMLVTFLEAYMEEGLISLAEKNPGLLKDAPPIAPARALEVNSLEELRDELRQQWAHGKLRPGGPETWVKRLTGMGARGYDKKACDEVQHLWDTRNLIVHSRGVASVAYVRKYASTGVKPGTQVNVSNNRFSGWLDSLKIFMSCTEAFFLSYKPPTE
jgi:hypothetical protein